MNRNKIILALLALVFGLFMLEIREAKVGSAQIYTSVTPTLTSTPVLIYTPTPTPTPPIPTGSPRISATPQPTIERIR